MMMQKATTIYSSGIYVWEGSHSIPLVEHTQDHEREGRRPEHNRIRAGARGRVRGWDGCSERGVLLKAVLALQEVIARY